MGLETPVNIGAIVLHDFTHICLHISRWLKHTMADHGAILRIDGEEQDGYA